MSNYSIEIKSKNEVQMMDRDEKVNYYRNLQYKWMKFKPFDDVSTLRRQRMIEAVKIRLETVIKDRDTEIEEMARNNLRMSRMEVIRVQMEKMMLKLNFDVAVCLEKISSFAQKQEDNLVENFIDETLQFSESMPVLIDSVPSDSVKEVNICSEFKSYGERRFMNVFEGAYLFPNRDDMIVIPPPVRHQPDNFKSEVLYEKTDKGDIKLSNAFLFGKTYYVLFRNFKGLWFCLYDRYGLDCTVACLEILGIFISGPDCYLSFLVKWSDSFVFPLFLLSVDGEERSKVFCLNIGFFDMYVNSKVKFIDYRQFEFKSFGSLEVVDDYYKFDRYSVFRRLEQIVRDKVILLPICEIRYENEKYELDDINRSLLSLDFRMLIKSFSGLQTFMFFVVCIEGKDSFMRVSDKVGYSSLDSLYLRFKAEFSFTAGKQYALAFLSSCDVPMIDYSLISYWNKNY